MKNFVLAVLLLAPLSGCGYNRLQGLDEDVKASWSEVQNQYQRRADLIPNLVSTVQGYTKHEEDTLVKVTQARSAAMTTMIDASKLNDQQAFEKFQQAQGQLTSALNGLKVVVEKYPDLKANQNFLDLQAQLEGTENRITVARKRYIDQVAEYNKGVRFFPESLTAKYLLHLDLRATFAATTEGADKAPVVKF